MPPKIALVAYIILLIGILKIERKQNSSPSFFLWIPTIYIMILASRPVGRWLNPYSIRGTVAEGSVYDRIILNSLIIIGLMVLKSRNFMWGQFFKKNRCLMLLYAFLGASILWSDYPFNSFKRWFKIFGIIIMALMVLSEKKPLKALESMLRRCAYVLIPLSIVLIKYFPQYGRSYTVHTGMPMGTGVATHKNSLGILCAMVSFFLLWTFILKLKSREIKYNKIYTFVDVTIFSIGLYLLFGGGATYSATSILIFVVGAVLMVVLYRSERLTKNMAAKLKSILIFSAILLILFYSTLLPIVTSSLNRREDLTDRDKIWNSVIEIASKKPILGVGYGGYWGLADYASMRHHLVNQSHNGYLEIYLQVGIMGIIIFIIFIFEFCNNTRRMVNGLNDWGLFGICFIIMVLLYNYSEAGFLKSNLVWSLTTTLSIVFSMASLSAEKEEDGLDVD